MSTSLLLDAGDDDAAREHALEEQEQHHRDDERTHRLLAELGYRHVGWHFEVEDWEPRHSGDDLARAVISGVEEHGDGAVVLLHSWPRSTGAGLAQMIGGLRDHGYDLVTVDELADG